MEGKKMESLKRWTLVPLILMIVFFSLSGCGFKDIEKRYFVMSIGIDPAKNPAKKYLISLKFAIPSVEKKPNEFMIVSQEADTIAEAVRMIKTKVGTEVDFSHAKVVLISNDVARKKIEPHIYYWFTRRRDFQEISWVAIAKPSAIDVLKVKPKSEQVPSNTIFLTLSGEGTENPYVLSEYLFDLKKRFTEKGLDPFLPIIEAKKDHIVVNTVGLFNKKKLKVSLSPDETKLLNFFTKKESKGAIKIKREGKYFLIDTQKLSERYKLVTTKKGKPVIQVKIKIKGRMEESLFKISNQDLSLYEKLTEKELNKQVKMMLIKLQKSNVDPIGFGLHYRGRHFQNNDWQTWQQLYPNVTFQVKTKVQIDDTGLVE
jgi:spore germination protein KC